MPLTAKDWSDLRWAAIFLIVCAALDWLLMQYFRRKKDEPFRTRVLDPWVIPFVIWLFALAPMLGRRGLPRWMSVTVLVAISLAAFPPILRKERRDRKASAALYRVADPSGGQAPRLLISKEEKKLAFYATLACVAAIGVSALAAILSLMMWAGQPVDTGTLAIAVGAAASTFLAFAFWKFGRWPGKVARSASIDVAAALDRVWDALALRDDYPGWKKIYTRIERLDEPGEVYRIHRAEDSRCPRCLLPRQPDRSLNSARIEVLEARRPSVYRLRSFSKGIAHRGDTAQWEDYEEVTYRLQPLAGGGTRLTYSGIAVRPKVWLAILVMLGGPAKENLRSLNAHLQGAPDESLFGVSAKRIEAARNAPRHCDCPA